MKKTINLNSLEILNNSNLISVKGGWGTSPFNGNNGGTTGGGTSITNGGDETDKRAKRPAANGAMTINMATKIV